MAFKVFLSHSLDPAEQALAWRLQTLAASHGIEMYVPRRDFTFHAAQIPSANGIEDAIKRSDCILAIVTAKANANVQRELKYALAAKKLVIPIVHAGLANSPLGTQFPKTFWFSPTDNPGRVEMEVVDFLKAQHLSKEKRQAAGALVAAGLALLLLFSLSEK